MTGSLVETVAALEPLAGARADIRPGDAVQLVVRAGWNGDGAIAWPGREELQRALEGKVTVLDDGAPIGEGPAKLSVPAASSDARAWRVQILLAPGERELPAVEVRLVAADGSELAKQAAPPIHLTVASVLDAPTVEQVEGAAQDPEALRQATTQALSPVRGPWDLAARVPWWWWAIALAAALLAAALVAWWWRRRAPTREAAPIPLEPAEVVARRRLAALRSGSLLARGEHLAFHVELADTLKEYLERRLGADLRERTTDEIRREFAGPLRAQRHVSEIRADVVAVLNACDLVKFARVVTPPSEALELVTIVERLVTRTTEAAPALPDAPDAARGGTVRPPPGEAA